MKITITGTNQIMDVSGQPCRIWEGTTESGVPIYAFVLYVAHHKDYDAQIEPELTKPLPDPSEAARRFLEGIEEDFAQSPLATLIGEMTKTEFDA